MTEETPAEGAPKEPVTPASDTPPESTPSQEFVSKADFEAGLEKLATRLKQSQSDVIEDRVTKAVSGKMSAFDEAAESFRPHLKEGVDVADIRRAAFLDNLIAESSEPSEPESPSPPQDKPPEQASSPSLLEQEIGEILKEHDLREDEPELLEYVKANQGKPWYKIGPGFADLAAKVSARKKGSPAGILAETGRKPPDPDLAQQYVDELATARDEGRRGHAVLREIKNKYRKLGLDVDNIRFEIPGVKISSRGTETSGLS